MGRHIALINLLMQHLGSMFSVIAETRDSGMSKSPSAAGIALDSMAVCLPCAGDRNADWGEEWPGLPALTTLGYSWHIPFLLFYSIRTECRAMGKLQ